MEEEKGQEKEANSAGHIGTTTLGHQFEIFPSEGQSK